MEYQADQKQNNAPTKAVDIPKTWPGGFGIYKRSKAAVKFNLGTIIVLLLANAVFSFLPNISDDSPSTSTLIIQFVFGVISLFVAVALINVYLASTKRQKMEVGQALRSAHPILALKYFGVSFLTGVYLFVSLLLIVPFFFVLPRLILAPYFLIDKKLGVFDAVTTSWNETKGHSLKVWSVIGAGIAMALLSVTIIGIPFSIYFLIMYSAVLAILYEYIKANQPSSEEPPYPKVGAAN